ncbi:vesicular glutamate transporter 2-like isoform X1 [Homalodisca vitripennis]|uniref:vesicular glutamate transporter 2-like isoform X1 n=1 Tax=Homalodisca vitripennis TaxID=197043 RepID=UPI001EEBFDD1|nr:vesicular glutamate transporter 2-like isoform X1 [Homalodisca vitripennis]
MDTLQFKTPPRWMIWKRRRHIVTILMCLGFANIYILRVNISIGIVAMNSPYNVTLSNGTVVERQDFNWDTKMQGLVLSSFFYGYLCTQLPGGWLGARFGGRTIFGVGVLVTALLTIFTPLAAFTSVYALVAVRVIEGFFEGGTFPCTQAIYAQWAPPQERSRVIGFTFMGSALGTVLGLQMSGLIGDVLGWASIFYITGAAGLVWSAVWFLVVKNCPDDDPHISVEELTYIKNSLGNSHHDLNKPEKITHPWGKIVTSLPLWAVTIANFSIVWGHYTTLTLLPMFMKDVFHYQLAKAGFITSVPYVVMGITMQFSGSIGDWLANKNIMSTTMVRKVLVCGPCLVQAACLSLVGHLTSIQSVLICLMLDLGMESFTLTAAFVNCLELAPQHASIVYGLSNTFVTIAGCLTPLISGFIVTDHSEDQWQIVFYIAAGVVLAGALFYGTFGYGEKLPWVTAEEKMEADGNVKTNKNSYNNKSYVEEAIS